MKLSRYSKLGILITISIVIFIWGMNFLKGIDFFKKNTTFYVIYPRVDGLQASSPVTLNGFKIGQVKKIGFSGQSDGSLIVSFSLNGDFRIPTGSVARIVSSDLMGTRSVKLIINPSDEFYYPHDTIPGSIEGDLKEQVSMQVLPLKNKAEQMLSSLDSAIMVITYVFNPEARENLAESFAHINQTISNLQETSAMLKELISSRYGSLQNTLTNLETLTGTLSNNSENFSNIVSNLSSISDTIAAADIQQIFADISEAINGVDEIIQKVNSNQGSAGRLINDESLYNNLAELSRNLDNLFVDIRKNPKRYLHFSAVDLSKSIYLAPGTSIEELEEKYVFKVNLVSSPSLVNTENPLFGKFQPVEEMETGGIFNYLTGSTSDFEKISETLDEAKMVFPDASIVAFKKGRPVKLEKALKSIARQK